MRKKVVAKTLRDLVTKMGKNEGKVRTDYYSFFDMEKALIPLYDISPDYQRNQWVAVRKQTIS